MKKLFLDIETIPAHKDTHETLREIHQRKADDGKNVKEFDEFVKDTSFDGAFGRICCISYAVDNNPVATFSGDEKEILKNFWDLATDIGLFIGFNLMDFDLRFIYQRSIILGIPPSKDLNFARYRKFPIYDIMWEWGKWSRDKISLHVLAKALGIPSSKEGEIEGKDVAQAYEDGRIKEICEYCERDVEVTREIYYKMTFGNPNTNNLHGEPDPELF